MKYCSHAKSVATTKFNIIIFHWLAIMNGKFQICSKAFVSPVGALISGYLA